MSDAAISSEREADPQGVLRHVDVWGTERRAGARGAILLPHTVIASRDDGGRRHKLYVSRVDQLRIGLRRGELAQIRIGAGAPHQSHLSDLDAGRAADGSGERRHGELEDAVPRDRIPVDDLAIGVEGRDDHPAEAFTQEHQTVALVGGEV